MKAPVCGVEQLQPGGCGVEGGGHWRESVLVVPPRHLLEVLLRRVRSGHARVRVSHRVIKRVHCTEHTSNITMVRSGQTLTIDEVEDQRRRKNLVILLAGIAGQSRSSAGDETIH